MLVTLHGVFLVYLALALAWNATASDAALPRRQRWERWTLLPLQLGLTGVLLVDRLRPGEAPLLADPRVAGLFPLACALGLAQNVHALLTRGARLSDIPIVLGNAGLLLASACGTALLAGLDPGAGATALVHDHAILQLMLGSPLALLGVPSWHLPLLVRREAPRSWPALLAGVFMAALAGWVAVVLAALLGEARAVVDGFAREPRLAAVRSDLHLAAWRGGAGWGGPGDCEALRLAADAEPRHGDWPQRPLLLELEPPRAWRTGVPDFESATRALIDAAERHAEALTPRWLLPFPEPDGLGSLLLGDPGPDAWRAVFEDAATRVAAVSPGTRLGVRLVGSGERSHALLLALLADPPVVSIAGPRLLPGPSRAGGAAAADGVLDTWLRWLEPLPAPPELWVLAAGCSAAAYGEVAQERFVEGCLSRACARPAVRGVVLDAWLDAGHVLGLQRADGSARRAGRRLLELLAAPVTPAPR